MHYCLARPVIPGKGSEAGTWGKLRDLCEVPRDEDTGMQPAGREGAQMTKRYFQEKQGEKELVVVDASKTEDTLGRHYF